MIVRVRNSPQVVLEEACLERWESAHLPGDVGSVGIVPPHFRVAPDADTRWYALYVRSKHEKAVVSSLKGKGYTVFSPSYRTKRQRVDRIAESEVALFPGYVFCQFDSNNGLPI